MRSCHSLIRLAVPRHFVSPHGFLVTAAALCLLYAVCHGLGWREYATFLSGNMDSDTHVTLGVIYVAAYFGCAVVVPILVLASAIFTLLLRSCRLR